MEMNQKEPIAILGFGCRFPGNATSPSKLWSLLSEPRDVLTEIPISRFNPNGFYHPNAEYHGHSNIKHAYLLSEDVGAFDAEFFNISAAEAGAIDPQQRILLECVFEALEHSNQQMSKLKGSDTAVYVGMMRDGYTELQLRDINNLPTHYPTGTSRSIVSNRISYFFDFHGPSMTIDTACSSSLVAVHEAVQALRSGTSRVAIAAGTNLILGPETFIAESTFHMLSPDGRSYMWDNRANGYGRGEGVAAVVLKRLSDAIADGDSIECIIRETGVNQDGRTKGITVPSADAQVALIQDTYRRAGLDLTTHEGRPQYFEAHGTGTPTGDPLEAEAIYRAIGSHLRAADRGTLMVGSIKSIIGHTEGTAGIAGLLKVCLALKHKSIPPNLLFDKLNPALKPFYKNVEVATNTRAWPNPGAGNCRRASVNSFGFGGTNAHAIVESFKSSEVEINDRNQRSCIMPVVFSAASSRSLRLNLEEMSRFLKKSPSIGIDQLALTLGVHRSTLPFRMSFSASNVSDLCNMIQSSLSSGFDVSRSPASKVLGIFTGQGAQWPGMGQELVQEFPFVRERFDFFDSTLRTLPLADRPSWTLLDEIMADSARSKLNEAVVSQPLCTALQIVLVDLLCAAGVKFAGVVGHSSGEIGAAYACGVISARDAIIIAYYRGLHSNIASSPSGKSGAMMAITTTIEDAEELCSLPEFEGRLCIAAYNSPTSITISGDTDAIEQAQAILDDEKKFARVLRVDKAYHSNHMLPCSKPYINSLLEAAIKVHDTRGGCVWFSSVYPDRRFDSSTDIRGLAGLNADYWRDNMVCPVRFSAAIEAALSYIGKNAQFAVEIGPHGALRAPVQDTSKSSSNALRSYTSCLTRNRHSVHSFAETIGEIWKNTENGTVNFSNLAKISRIERSPHLIQDLPTYRWNHDRAYWHESRRSRAMRTRTQAGHHWLGTLSPDSTDTNITWYNSLRISEMPWMVGHQLQGQIVFPAAGYLILAIEAGLRVVKAQRVGVIEVENFLINKAIIVSDEKDSVETVFSLHIEQNSPQTGVLKASFQLLSAVRHTGNSTLNATGTLKISFGDSSRMKIPHQEAESPNMIHVPSKQFYTELRQLGYHYTETFQALGSMRRKFEQGRGTIQVPSPDNVHSSQRDLVIQPGALDSAFQGLFLAYSWPGDGALWSLHVPTSIRRLVIDPNASTHDGSPLTFDAYITPKSSGNNLDKTRLGILGDVDIFADSAKQGFVQIEGINLLPLAPTTADQDVPMFFENIYGASTPDCELAAEAVGNVSDNEVEVVRYVISQITFRYPRAKILEIKPNHDSTSVMEASKSDELVQLTSSDLEILDTASTPIQQPYDIIIVPINMLDADKLLDTLSYLHKISRSGAYFIGFGLTSMDRGHISQSPVAFNRLPLTEWNGVLIKAGFTGIDTVTPERRGSGPFTVMVSRATTETFSLLLEPSNGTSPLVGLKDCLIITGSNLANHRLSASIIRRLKHHCSSIHTAENFGEISPNQQFSNELSLIVLADLDRPVFESLSQPDFDGLKALLMRASSVVWATRGRRQSQPFSNMSVGVGRVVMSEMPHLRMKFIDFDDQTKPTAGVFIDAILRLNILRRLEKQGDEPLWSQEAEVFMEGDRQIIPRIKQHRYWNAFYNSTRRDVRLDFSPSKTPVEVGEQQLYLCAPPRNRAVSEKSDLVEVRVLYVFSHAVPVLPNLSLYICIGMNLEDRQLVVTMLDNITSIARVPHSLITVLHVASRQSTPNLLAFLAAHVLASSISRELKATDTVVLLNCDPSTLEIFREQSASKGFKIGTSSTSGSELEDLKSITLHRFMTRRRLQNSLYQDSVHVIDFSNARVHNTFSTQHPLIERYIEVTAFQPTKNPSQVDLIRASQVIATTVESISKSLNYDLYKLENPLQILSPEEFLKTKRAWATVLNWAETETVPVSLQATHEQIRFRGDRTYLLVGLANTGGLGPSLAEWMINQGARHIVLTSRTPKATPGWVLSFDERGANIKIIANDVTDRDALQSMIYDLKTSGPPIGGVVNGAMILQDATFERMTYNQMVDVLRPKVDGSRFLDEAFQDDDLEFFILLSSLANVVGNSGQANYVAANMYMTSLAAQRRHRGLAGSAIDLGTIFGVGLISRDASEGTIKKLAASGYIRLSERDFHAAFANAIVAGRPGSATSEEVITGLNVTLPDPASGYTWRENPRFSHVIQKSRVLENSANHNPSSVLTIRERLRDATIFEDIRQIVQDEFVVKLRSILQLQSDKTSDPDLLQRAPEDLGVDSLVAVELRSWFLREFDFDILVLKIITAVSFSELLECLLDGLPRTVTPSLDKAAQPLHRGSEPLIAVPPSISSSSAEPERSVDDVKGVQTSEPSISDEISSSTPLSTPAVTEKISILVPLDPIMQETLPMAFAQSGFWFMSELVADKTLFNGTISLLLTGTVEVPVLAKAVRSLGKRHVGLRARFFNNQTNQPTQAILTESSLTLETRTIHSQVDVHMEFQKINSHIYDIGRGETLRMMLLSESSTRHHLVIGYHHINIDASSLLVLISDLQKLYSGVELPPPALQHTTFTRLQLARARSNHWQDEISYWQSEFPYIPDSLPILKISPYAARARRSTRASYRHFKAEARITGELAAKVRSTCKRFKVTSFHLFCAIFYIVLARLSDTEDICIGVANANRTDEGATEAVGIFLNLFPLRLRSSLTQKFSTILKNTRTKVLTGLQNSSVPFDVILNEVNAQRDPTNTPLFQAFIDYIPVVEKQRFGDCELQHEEYDFGQTMYDIMMGIVDNPVGDAWISMMLQEELYTKDNANMLLQCYLQLLEAFVTDPELEAWKPQMYNEVDINRGLQMGRGHELEFLAATMLHDISIIALKQPDAIALRDTDGSTITYKGMIVRYQAIARALEESHIPKNSRIAVLQEPTVDWICSMLAIWYRGHAYVPLEVGQGAKRLSTIVRDAAIDSFIIHQDTATLFKELDCEQVRALINTSELDHYSSTANTASHKPAPPGEEAIVLYTSGSTGVPKGISLPHHMIVNTIQGFLHHWPMEPQTVLQQIALSFDVSWWQSLIGLATGGTVVVAGRNHRKDPVSLTNLIVSENVTLTLAVPSEAISWLQFGDLPSLRKSGWKWHISAGEDYSFNLITQLQKLSKMVLRSLNAYGPAETIVPHVHEVQYLALTNAELPIPIGKVMPNYTVYIIDDQGHPVPPGVPGQLAIGGAGVANGYVNNHALTENRFPVDKQASAHSRQKGWTRAHLSGDRGYIRSDGVFVLQSRIAGDTQIKLRGQRIDVKEIEACITNASQGSLTNTIVHLRHREDDDPSSAFLVAHAVCNDTTMLKYGKGSTLKAHLEEIVARTALPPYMRPSIIQQIDSLPLNHHGKIDRRALAELPLSIPNRDMIKPYLSRPYMSLTEPQTKMKDIWLSCLGEAAEGHHIHHDSDFFQVGGNSLILVSVREEIRRRLDLTVPLVKLFELTTLAEMATMVGRDSNDQEQFRTSNVDWSKETQAASVGKPVVAAKTSSSDHKGLIVVLTGASGFLGRHLLQKLTRMDQIQVVHCIAVRDTTRMTNTASPKVKVYLGDLAQPLLGLTEEKSQHIFNEANVVIHNGADVSFMKSFPSLRATNLGSTKELVRLISGNGAGTRFHYISTAGITQLGTRELYEEPQVVTPPTDVSNLNGYVVSKWASEKYLENVNEASNLPVTIHRPTTIIGDDAPRLDVMHNVLHFSQQLRHVPKIAPLKRWFQFVNIDDITRDITESVLEDTRLSSQVVYKNHCGREEDAVKIDQLAMYLERKDGVSYGSMEVVEWISKASKSGLAPEVAEYLKNARGSENWVFPRVWGRSRP